MGFSKAFEKTAMSPGKVESVAKASQRLYGKSGRNAARDLADEYRLFKATKKPIKPKIRDLNKEFPKAAAAGSLLGARGGLRPLSKPARITGSTKPLNPVHGLNGLTGAPAAEPFQHSLRQFGRSGKPRSLVSRTAIARGPK